MIKKENLLNYINNLRSFNPLFLLTELNTAIPNASSQEFLTKSIEYSATTLHAKTHWFQFIGTNYGRIMLLMIQSRYNLFFGGEGVIIPKSLFNRVSETDILEDCNINPRFIKDNPENSAIFLQDWIDHSISFNFLLNGTKEFEEVKSLPYSVATSLAYTHVCTNNFLNSDYSVKVLDIEKKLTFSDFCILGISNSETLTVLDLLEGQARISSALQASAIARKENNKEQDFNFNDNNENWKAWNIFTHIYCEKDRRTNFYELAALFSTLIDIALAIPFPPFVPNHYLDKLSWSDIYPPIRFIHLCKKVASLGLEIKLNDPSNITESIEKICSFTGYFSSSELDQYFLNTYKILLEEIEAKFISKQRDYSSIGMYDYYLLLFKKSAELRMQSPFAISNIAIAQSMPYVGNLTEVFLNLDQKHSLISSSPIIIDINKGARKAFTPFPQKDTDIFQWISTNLIIRKIVTEHLLLGRPVKSTDFPFDIPTWAKDVVKQEILKLFDIVIEWQ